MMEWTGQCQNKHNCSCICGKKYLVGQLKVTVQFQISQSQDEKKKHSGIRMLLY